MDFILGVVSGVLLVFYLFLLIRWDYVRRVWLYCTGMLGWGVIWLGWLLGACELEMAMRVLNVVGLGIALDGALGSCYAGKLPFWDVLFPPCSKETCAAEQQQPEEAEQAASE